MEEDQKKKKLNTHSHNTYTYICIKCQIVLRAEANKALKGKVGGGAKFHRAVREDLSDKVNFKVRSEDSREEFSRQWKE